MTNTTKTTHTDGPALELDEIATRAASEDLTPGPWRLDREQCDCSDGYCHHGEYVTGVITPVPTGIAAERLARTGEQPRDYDFHRSEIGDFTDADWELMVHAREDVPALIAEIRRLTDRVAELEAYAHGCDGEGCVLPHSSWCEVAKKAAAANDGCTCPRPWEGHPQPHAGYCWLVSPPRNEMEEMRRALAERSASEQPAAPDTLPAWLRQRFTASDVSWEHLDDGERSYWEHQARAVRRAVARNGFKPGSDPAAVSSV